MDNLTLYCPDRMKIYNIKESQVSDFEKFLESTPFIYTSQEEDEDKTVLNQLTLDVCDTCNLQCKYCYANGGTYNKKTKYMTSSQMMSAYKQIINLYPKGIKHISYFGGEPLMNIRAIKEFTATVTQYAKEKGYVVPTFSLITNGTLLTDKVLSFFKEYNFSVTVSLDGDKNLNDKNRVFQNSDNSVFEIVKSNLNNNNSNYHVKIYCESTLTPDVYKQYKGNIYNYVKTFIDLGFEYFYPFPALGEKYDFDYAKEDIQNNIFKFYTDFTKIWLDSFVNENSDLYFHIPLVILSLVHAITSQQRIAPCKAGQNSVYYAPDNKFYICQMYYKDGTGSDVPILNSTDSHQPFDGMCKECISKYTCSSWCPGNAYSLEYKHDGLDPRCILQKATVNCILIWLTSLTKEQRILFSQRMKKLNNR